ncbi:FeoC-like transcriptional regulator [Corynebacterium xerosis]|uniref:FeoC-like transcriptional regulator n=1 Tax=Corynebacterium xerosis TaxID=1725 RepID=UPI003879B29F
MSTFLSSLFSRTLRASRDDGPASVQTTLQSSATGTPLAAVRSAIADGVTSRSAIAAATGLSRSTVDAAIDHLERTGSLRRERMASSCPSGGCGGCAHAGGDGSACPSSRIGDGPPGPVALVLTRRS